MHRSSTGSSSLSSSSWSKESYTSDSRSSRPGASASGPTRGRSPRRSPSPWGRRRSPSGSRSSRRSPPPRRRSPGRSPSGGRRGSEQRDGSFSRRLSVDRHPQFASRRTPSRHSEPSEEQSMQTAVGNNCYGIDPLERRRCSDRVGSPINSRSDVDRGDFTDFPVFGRHLSCLQLQQDFNKNYDHLQDIVREPDRDGELPRKYLYSLEERGREPKCLQYDREDRLLDVSKRNYRKRVPSRSPSPGCPDEDYRDLDNYRSKKNTCQDTPRSGYVIPGLINSVCSSAPQFLHTPEKAPTMPKKSILKKRVDDPSVQVENSLKCFNKNAVAESVNKESQACVDGWRAFLGLQPNAFPTELNFGSSLRKKEDWELTSEPADLHDDFLLPHESASQDGNGIPHILDRMADSASTQDKIRHSFLDVEHEEKFIYGDNDSNGNYPTEKLTMNSGEKSVSLNKRPLSPIQSVKLDPSEGSGIEYEKIHDLLKTIGLDIGVAEIGKGAARTQERLHGKKTLHFLAGPSHKADSSEEDSIQSNTHSSELNQKNSLSPCDSSQPSNEVPSALIPEHAKNTTVLVEYENSAGKPEQSFSSVSATPSAPPSPPKLPLPPLPFSPFLAAQVPQSYPPPEVAPPSGNAYGHGTTYSSSAWPTYTPPQQSDPALPYGRGLVSSITPPKPTRSNLKVIETVSSVSENPDIKINKSVLVEVPITPAGSISLSQSSGTDRISDGKKWTSKKPQVIEGQKPMSEQQRKKLVFLMTELNRRNQQQWKMLMNNYNTGGMRKDPFLEEINKVQDNIVKEIAQLQLDYYRTEMKQSHLDSVSHITGINTGEKSWKKASENIDFLQEEKAKKKKTQKKHSLPEHLNKLCEKRRSLNQSPGLTPVQKTDCSLKRKQQEEDGVERSAKVARSEESEITKELREVDDENIYKGKDFRGQKSMIRLVLKKDNIQKEEGEVEESQKKSNLLSSEKYSLRKTEMNNQSQNQDAAVLKAQSPGEDKCRENKSQSGNPDSKQKVTVTKVLNLGMKTKEQKSVTTLCHLLTPLAPGPSLSLVATSALNKPAPAEASDVKSSDASTELFPVVKKDNPELVLSPNIVKAFSGGTAILKSSQENVKLQEPVEVQLQEPKSVSDIMEHAKVQKKEVTEAKAQKVEAAEEWATPKMVKMKEKLQTSQKSHPPYLTPGPPSLLSLQLRPLLSLVPALPHPPQPLSTLPVSGPANKEHSLGTPSFPCLKRRGKRMTVSAGQKKSVWIVGHSVVFQTGTYAASTGWDSNLGLGDHLHITWLGYQQLHWPVLLTIISNQVFHRGPPDAIIIQLGGKDLLAEKSILLSRTMSADLHTLHGILPQTSLFWSALLEQCKWHGAVFPSKVDRSRLKVCNNVSQFVENLGGFTIPHPDISSRLASLFQADGVHLSEWGMDIWLHDIRYALLKWLQA